HQWTTRRSPRTGQSALRSPGFSALGGSMCGGPATSAPHASAWPDGGAMPEASSTGRSRSDAVLAQVGSRSEPSGERNGPDLRLTRRRFAEAGFAGYHDRLGAVGDVELHEDVRDVVADRLLAEVQRPGDLRVAAALGDQGEDLAFPVGQLGEHRA